METAYDENEKEAFKEEKANLARIETILDEKIEKSRSEENKYNQIVVNKEYNYIDDKFEYLRIVKSSSAQIEEYVSMKKSPYFGRIDVAKNGEPVQTFYVGYYFLDHQGNPEIVSWKSELGNTFYQKSTKEFNVAGTHRKLYLRRSIDIKNAELIQVQTEFDIDNVSLDGEIIDSFLISVLRDKRRNYRLSDIVRTIQENQNNIIRKPLEESFVVQGCAGSGKTMILLHRLSYLIYNNPRRDFSKWCILTPNEHFNRYIEDLSKQLDIKEIKLFTVEEYYQEILRNLLPGEVIQSGDKVTAAVQSEKNLDCKMLTKLYSCEFRDRVIALYEDIWAQAITLLQEEGYQVLLDDFASIMPQITFTLPNMNVHKISTYYTVLSLLSTMKNKIEEKCKEYRSAQGALQTLTEKNEKAPPQGEKEKENAQKEKDRLRKIMAENQPVFNRQDMLDTIVVLYNSLQKELNFKTIRKKLLELRNGIYKKYGFRTNQKTNYRHKLYINLLIASLYFVGPGIFHNYVNIDEAQDLATTEYLLFQDVLGEKCVFNLYGDVNQLIYDYKGIEDWEDIPSVTDNNIYFLNENYRNTVEITEYCNETFNIKVTAIGLRGDKVVKCDLSSAIERMLSEERQKSRRAIIYKRGVEGINGIINSLIKPDMLVWDSVDANLISVIPVEMAKGLEFESVIVVSNYMTNNEKYLSFTRALESLFVTECHQAVYEGSHSEGEDADFLEEEEDFGENNEAAWLEKYAVEYEEKDTLVAKNREGFEIDCELPPLPYKAEKVSFEECAPYITSYFRKNLDLSKKFWRVGEYLQKKSPDVFVKVSQQYIGFASPKTNNYCILYVSRSKTCANVIKFQHNMAVLDFAAISEDELYAKSEECSAFFL